ncbi:zinc-binding dehydrogenase [candidate division KSB1 bacterium]|nr:zinc-binding dehydrogenase [candidate division KSB1 bacterium]
MKQMYIMKNGGVDVLRLIAADDPLPAAGEVRIRVRASGVNFADIMARMGLYPDAPPKPCVVGYEVSGTIDSVGSGVTERLVGEEVLAVTKFGGYSDVVVVSERQTFVKPKRLSFEQAAAIPVNYLTAYQLLVVMGGLQNGETILIHNAGGGVGLAALEIARHIGARTIGTSSTRKHEFLKSKGLDHALAYQDGDWYQRLMEITDNKGVELIVDPIGGENWRLNYKALRSTGRLGVFGISNVSQSGKINYCRLLMTLLRKPKFDPIHLMNRNRGVFGVNMGHLWHEVDKIREWMRQLLDGVEDGWINPHIDSTFPLQEVASAHLYLEQRKNMGKVLLIP